MTYVNRDGWWCAGAVFVLVLVVYAGTMNPTVSLEQAGALVVAADHLGIGKFPGIPLWHLVAHAFTRIFSGAEYAGHQNPVWATTLFSAVSGALACSMVAYAVSLLSRSLLRPESTKPMRPVCVAASIAAGCLLAFSPVMWSQSVVTETHAFTAAFAALFLTVLLHWVSEPAWYGERSVLFLFALGLSVSHLLVLFAPVVVLAAGWAGTGLRRSCAVALGLAALMVWASLRMPTVVLATWVMGGVIIVCGAGLLVPITRRTAQGVWCLLAGLLPYAYLPVAASNHPPMNMGMAYTWEGFRHLIGRGQYERIVPVNPLEHPGLFAGELEILAERVAEQFMMPMVLFGLVPLMLWPWIRGTRGPLGVWLACLISFAVLTTMGIGYVPHDLQSQMLVTRMFLPVYLLWAVGIGVGILLVFERIRGCPASSRLDRLKRMI
jgi:uncharacterized membrane protein